MSNSGSGGGCVNDAARHDLHTLGILLVKQHVLGAALHSLRCNAVRHAEKLLECMTCGLGNRLLAYLWRSSEHNAFLPTWMPSFVKISFGLQVSADKGSPGPLIRPSMAWSCRL